MRTFILLLAVVITGFCFSKRCLKPIKPGVPTFKNAQAKLWYGYDSKKNQCVAFYYNGSKGNSNRFEYREDCERECVKAGSNVQRSYTRKRRRRLTTTPEPPLHINGEVSKICKVPNSRS
ncbi:Kunitz/Bovine pancreatic trypsin inhibitor domain protein [Oesophagostomum dentatum]|uniref:Kunitz/Bovine pancreatic trypsin inhibitor domain protein n=1 Tax=Oesophagostomum dentatum TaxID=61180 RepID=A0A0B1TDX9_OESDE|nr:Kunitz/Bovine pancreatic trypsin inhibitor domain protein [Oesophagostomum dentatum]